MSLRSGSLAIRLVAVHSRAKTAVSDGKCIVAHTNTGLLAVVVVASGEALPLTFSTDLYLPDWRP